MPDWVSGERLKLMQSYKANVVLISKEDGGFLKCIEEAKKLAKKENGFLANQFENVDNYLAHYDTTAKEIIDQIPEDIHGFVSGIGTGGTLMGVGKKLKEINENTIITAIEPDSMPMLSKGEIIEQHKIEGIGDDFIPGLVDRDLIDEIILINDEDAINMSRRLSGQLGLGVGISSGANLIGSILLQEKINHPVVTVFADDNKKYLSTDLSKDIDLNEDYISNSIELIDFTFV